MTEVTHPSLAYGTQASLRHMRPRDKSVMVNVGSALTNRSIPLQRSLQRQARGRRATPSR